MKTPVITPQWIERTKRVRACDAAIKWLRMKPRTVAELARESIGASRFVKCAKRAPRTALVYAAEHLPPELKAELEAMG